MIPSENLFKFYAGSLLNSTHSLSSLYTPFINALEEGNIALFDDYMAIFEKDLYNAGTYLAIERVRFIVLRELFRKT